MKAAHKRTQNVNETKCIITAETSNIYKSITVGLPSFG